MKGAYDIHELMAKLQGTTMNFQNVIKNYHTLSKL